jgi:hypothetical protein
MFLNVVICTMIVGKHFAICTVIIVHIANSIMNLYNLVTLYSNIVQFAMCTKISVRITKSTISDFVCNIYIFRYTNFSVTLYIFRFFNYYLNELQKEKYIGNL